MSLEAKAGLIGAFYALEQLFAKSGRVGTDLTNFNAVLGVSAQTLQRYQYAARQVGVSNEAVAQSFKTIQSVMTKALLGEGVPKGLARLAQVTGRNLSPADLKKFAQNPEELIQLLQTYAQKEKNAGLRNEVLESFGVGSIVPALTRNAFRPEVLAKAPTYSDQETGKLDQNRAAWANLENKFEMAVGHFNAKHGGQLVSDISKLVDVVMRLADAFVILAEKVHLFDHISDAFEGWTESFKLITNVIDTIEGSDEKKKEKLKKDAFTKANEASTLVKGQAKKGVQFVGKLLGFENNEKPIPAETARQLAALKAGKPIGPNAVSNLRSIQGGAISPRAIAPPAPNISNAGDKNTTTTVNQNMTFNGATDPKKVGHEVKKAVNDAYRANPATAGGY